MSEPILVNSIEHIDRLHSLIRHDLRDLGIKLPKSKKVKKQNQSKKGVCLSAQDGTIGNKIFGEALSQIPCVFLAQYGYVPQFLISTADLVLKNLDSEGIFRKSGSVGRQKELRTAVEEGKPIDEANINDITSLIKQFFRELPEPLILSIYQDAFVKCFQLSADKDPKTALLYMCLLLPAENVGALRYLMHLLYRVSQRHESNRMTSNNLALVVAPNLIGSLASNTSKPVPQKMSAVEEKNLHSQTCIIELFIKNWEQIGMVPGVLRQQLSTMTDCDVTDDDLDVSDDNILEESKDPARKKKRRRSGSLSGIVSSIAQGIAKLRRSSDGKGINMSTNSTIRSEVSMYGEASMISAGDISRLNMSEATPNIMRKRRLSGETVPFSSNKKQAILGALPQRSALGSTPFTPATLKRDPTAGSASASNKLNSTTPIMGTKNARKKLNLFNTSGSNKKMRSILPSFYRQNSVSGRLESPPAKSGKGKNIFRKMSGSRDKSRGNSSSLASESMSEQLHTTVESQSASPRPAVSDSALDRHNETDKNLIKSASSPSLQDASEGSILVVDDDSEVFLPNIEIKRDKRVTWADGGRVRSKSEDSPLSSRTSKHSNLDKSMMDDPSPERKKSPNKDVRRSSRRDDFEKQQKTRERSAREEGGNSVKHSDSKQAEHSESKQAKETKNKDSNNGSSPNTEQIEISTQPSEGLNCLNKDTPSRPTGIVPNLSYPDDFNKSVCSQLDDSLMEAVLPPPHGFGDQTLLEEELLAEAIEDIDDLLAVVDDQSEAGFSTISGGTVLHRTESGNYTTPSRSGSDVSIGSSVSRQGPVTQPMMEISEQENPYVTLQDGNGKGKVESSTGEYVVLRQDKPKSKTIQKSLSLLGENNSQGMTMLFENYNSSEEDSSNSSRKGSLNTTINSLQDDFDNMPRQTDVTKGKSLSAEDLPMRAKVPQPTRAQSLYMSPCRRFNYKPHLEISRDTHKLLSRAGYMNPPDPLNKSHDFQVPVKSPTRSAQREQIKAALRSSFNERHSRLSASLRSSGRSRLGADVNTSVWSVQSGGSAVDASISSHCDISGQNITSAGGDSVSVSNQSKDSNYVTSSLKDKFMQNVSDALEKKLHTVVSKETVEVNVNTNNTSHVTGRGRDVESLDSSETKHDHGFNLEGAPQHEKVVSLKSGAKDLNLSGFLNQKLENRLQIKRAEMAVPRRDSILHVKNPGRVAESVRHFSKPESDNPPSASQLVQSTKKKAEPSIVRIPTIFSKGDVKRTSVKDLAGLARDNGTSSGELLNIPGLPATPRVNNLPDECDESFLSDEGNVTVMEANSDTPQENGAGQITPQKSNASVKMIKSPLLESTNTAAVASPRIPANITDALTDLCRPTSEALSALSKPHPRPPTPVRGAQVKRLKKSDGQHRFGEMEGKSLSTAPPSVSDDNMHV